MAVHEVHISFFKPSNEYLKVRKTGSIHDVFLTHNEGICLGLYPSAHICASAGTQGNKKRALQLPCSHTEPILTMIHLYRAEQEFLPHLPTWKKEEGFMGFLFLCVNQKRRKE